jgi:1,4-alpha-glucan branching enzyme
MPTDTPPLRQAPADNTENRTDVKTARERLRAVYGVRCTRQGVAFVQPAEPEQKIFVAGDFNHWSPSATRLHYDGQIGVAYTIVPIPPGRYQYRLIIDGAWQADPYNNQQQHNDYGEPNSVLVVPPPKRTVNPEHPEPERIAAPSQGATVLSHRGPS